jgi:uncharacterized protein (TIGR00730 family)
MNLQKVCVYCASSRQCDPAYHEAAHDLGKELAAHNITIVYGGGLTGSMGALANAALAHGGRVIGILPQFMHELEWGHTSLTELIIVNDIHERKRLMISGVDAIIALPGGCGTLEELFEAITWKRLGLYCGPIVLVNTLNFFAPCIELLNRCIEQRFMDPRHAAMWSVAEGPADILEAIHRAPRWRPEYRSFAGL